MSLIKFESGIIKHEVRVKSYELKPQERELQLISVNSNTQVTSSNPRIKCPNP